MTDISLTQSKLLHFQQFQILLPDVRDYIRQHLPLDWPELESLLGVVLNQPLGSLSTLPLASCVAVGGNPKQAIPVAAAWEMLCLAMRILDDVQDQDRPEGLWATVGLPRAINFGTAVYTMCYELLAKADWSPELYCIISRKLIQAGLQLSSGQDKDLRGETRSVEDYWQTIEGKNASAFAWACAAGALCGTNDTSLVEACRGYGYHLGLALQLFDDFEGTWETSGLTDLAQGKVTLPVIYGCNLAHEQREKLQFLVNSGQIAAYEFQIRNILDSINTRDFIIWAALKEREQALASLDPLPQQEGVTALVAYVSVIFTHVEDLLLKS
ncbi:polyprenyl synthetase family protein [Brunnivagina elsteri]|uniref:Polyprenyl synthetase superfamily n=1 Tax=Brunnivagina elsteri CCALA 953 TaxID=987040 RepID=A0A2A2TJD1_9CYAN|nr:polyprenyl synthetase family protein [Calothrix elsteri]PAX54537.1 polyprenyl synthetase superfamily [Calothrix elsteri CCALA 953]